MGLKDKLISAYDKNYKALMIIPMLLLFASLIILFLHHSNTGEFVDKGVSLKGGITVTIPVQDKVETLSVKKDLNLQLPYTDIVVRKVTELGATTAVIVEVSDVSEEELINSLRNIGFPMDKDSFTVESMGSTLGKSFFRQTFFAVILAFAAMGIVVLITFRKLVPALFVILAAASDILSTLAVVSLLEIKLSTAGIAAFLMLIGYSVDTDILLTTKVLKGKQGTILERTVNAMKTGLTMSVSSLIAALAGYFLTQSDVIKQITFIIIFGLIFDIIYTWLQNAGILRWYLERKERTEPENG